MADQISKGPVKSPVIDLTARPVSNDAPDDTSPDDVSFDDAPTDDVLAENALAEDAGVRTETTAAETPPAQDSGRRARLGFYGALVFAGAGIGGALAGFGLTQIFPKATETRDLSGELNAQAAKLVGLEEKIAAFDTRFGAVDKTIADLRASDNGAGLAPLEAEVKSLGSQLDAIAAGAPGAETAVLVERIGGLDVDLEALRAQLEAGNAERVPPGPHPGLDPAAKLPLIIMGLEKAFTSGASFAAEFAALRGALPDFPLPAQLTAKESGLPAPSDLSARFTALLPEIIAATPRAEGDWAQNALDTAKTLLVLRPAGEMEGTEPDALVSRLEGAMARGDFPGAEALIAQLPAPMQAAVAPVQVDVASLADAQRFLDELRVTALAQPVAP